MKNKVILTDDELALIQTSLMLTLTSHKEYVEQYGEEGLDFQTKEGIKGMIELYERLKKEYF